MPNEQPCCMQTGHPIRVFIKKRGQRNAGSSAESEFVHAASVTLDSILADNEFRLFRAGERQRT